MTNKIHFSPMFVFSYALLPCILGLESMGCRLSSVLCFLSSVNWPLIPNVIVRKYLRLCKAFYNCRDTFTDVMGALQIHFFMQNKAKFQKVKLNVTKVITNDYDQMDTWSIRKNKAKTNPNKAKTNPILANKTPIRTQFKPKQTQFIAAWPLPKPKKTQFIVASPLPKPEQIQLQNVERLLALESVFLIIAGLE